jgi:hypothetical protein
VQMSMREKVQTEPAVATVRIADLSVAELQG